LNRFNRFDKLTAGKLTAGKLTVGKLTVGKLTVGKLGAGPWTCWAKRIRWRVAEAMFSCNASPVK
jgi:hypothetical protein